MSLSDWNDKKNGAYMVLSATQVYEGVKSLRTLCKNADEVIKILDKSEIDLPKSVAIDFWLFLRRGSFDSNFSMFFRYQDIDNFYLFRFQQWSTSTHFLFGRKETGVYYWNADRTLDADVKNEWVHWKAEFCELDGTVYLYLYKEVAGEWVLKETESQSPAKFTGGGAFGVGAVEVGGNCGADGYAYLDITKIYY